MSRSDQTAGEKATSMVHSRGPIILACPGCRQDLSQLEACDACGLAFGKDGDTPVFLAPEAEREVSFRFSSSHSSVSNDLLS